jgi:two-component system, sensor histidine kinase PdtaS
VNRPLFAVHIRHDRDIVYARQRARLVADRLGFDTQDQTRIATAVSEVCRNAYAYAGGGRVEFRLEEPSGIPTLVIEISDKGPGIADLGGILAGHYRSSTGLGLGLAGTRRLVDRLEIKTTPAGTNVRIHRRLSRPVDRPMPEFVNRLVDDLARHPALDPVEEVQRQNQELMHSLFDLRQREEDLLRANAELRDSAEALRASNAEKEVLLKEVYHRVKNNLQIISSLVSMKARKSSSPLVRRQLEDVRTRIHSLSLVHEKLYQSDDLAHIDLSGYVRDLCSHLRVSFLGRGEASAVELTVEADRVSVSLDMAIQLGLLINEIVTNALKHAFDDGQSGRVHVRLTVQPPDRLLLEVADNGKGLPEPEPDQASESLGMNLIRALAARVDGNLTMESNGGTTVTVNMPLYGD